MLREMCGAATTQHLLLVCCACIAVAAQTSLEDASLGVLTANGMEYRGRLQELHYYDGMPVNFTCARVSSGPHSQAAVQISYHSQESNAVTTSFQLKNSVYMYLKLREANNDTILTCSVRDDSNNDSNTSIIQMRLLLRNVLLKEGFEVNGQFLPQLKDFDHSWDGVQRYEYHFIREEPMAVRLVKDERKYDKVWCSVSGRNFPGSWPDHVWTNRIMSPAVGVHLVNTSLSMEHSGTTITCRLLNAVARNKKNVLLEVTFIYYDLVPFIGGLSMSNVTLLYKDKTSTRVTYAGNSTYQLTCNPDGPATTSMWIFYPSEVFYSDAKDPKSFIMKDGVKSFIMKDGVKSTLIKCLRKSDNSSIPERLIELWLRRQESPPVTERHVHDKGTKWIPPIAEVSVAFILIVLVLLILAVWFAWRRWYRGAPLEDRIELQAPDARSFCISEEHHYEDIKELSPSGEPPNIAQRPQLPLPETATLEESGGAGSDGERYRHYDTPYEWRIFRFGVRPCGCRRCAR